MLRKLFGGKPAPATEVETAAIDDALARGMTGARALYPWLLEQAETERGVHIESLLVTLGALAGRACHLAARDAITTAPLPHWGGWAEATTADGRPFHFGDPINHFLMEGALSLWEIASAGASQAGADRLPDVASIAGHVASTVGDGNFGRIRFPEGTHSAEGPEDYLRLWPKARTLLEAQNLEPQMQTVAFGLAASEVLRAAKDVIDPATALHILMESAIVTAKLAPEPAQAS